MSTSRPLIIGEVLFDHFPNGERRLGGAPFNVAWNLKGLGFNPLLITSVGQDEAGKVVLDSMRDWGLDTSGIQQSPNLPTGKVEVALSDGQPTFDILADRAWDELQAPNSPLNYQDFSLLYAGSLASRCEPSRSVVLQIAQQSKLPLFVDVNIRQPWFDRQRLTDLLPNAGWVKLNESELAWIAESPCENQQQIEAASHKVRKQYGGDTFLITCGADGAYAIESSGDTHFAPAPEPAKLVDTVGAGDAFAAAMIAGIARQDSLSASLSFAARFASRACTIQGATSHQPDHYALESTGENR